MEAVLFEVAECTVAERTETKSLTFNSVVTTLRQFSLSASLPWCENDLHDPKHEPSWYFWDVACTGLGFPKLEMGLPGLHIPRFHINKTLWPASVPVQGRSVGLTFCRDLVVWYALLEFMIWSRTDQKTISDKVLCPAWDRPVEKSMQEQVLPLLLLSLWVC